MSVRRSPAVGSVPGARVSRYDIILALLPAPLLLGVLVALTAAVPLAYGAGAGSVGSALVLGYGLFVDAPTPADDRGAAGGHGRGREGHGGAPADD